MTITQTLDYEIATWCIDEMKNRTTIVAEKKKQALCACLSTERARVGFGLFPTANRRRLVEPVLVS